SETVRIGGRSEFERANSDFLGALGPEKGVAVYRCPPVTTASDVALCAGISLERWREIAPRGVRDIFAVSGQSGEGLNLMLGAPMRETHRTGRADRALWSRVAAHLASSFRLRTALQAPVPHRKSVEAVLQPSGRCEHAEAEAQGRTARAALREAAISMERL